MASSLVFNPAPPPTNDPTYGRESRAHQRDVVVDKTYESLFKGLGQVVDVTAKGLDYAVKKDIDINLYKRLDEERDAFGVGDTQAMAVMAGSPLDRTKEGVFRSQAATDELNHLGPQVERLNQAHASGKLSNRYYHARLESIVRQYRAMYPGYREYIDQKVAEITGVVPANALRRDILQELEAMTKGDGENRKENLLKELGPHVSPVVQEAFATDRISSTQFIMEANKQKRHLANNALLKSEYDTMEVIQDWNDKNVVKNMQARGRTLLNSAVGTFSSVLGVEGGFDQFQDNLTRIATGELKVEDQVLVMMSQRYGNFLTRVRKSVSEELGRPNASGQTPPRDVVNKQVDELMKDLTFIGNHITTDPKDMQLVGSAMRRLKAMENDDQLSFVLNSELGDIVRTAGVVKRMVGEQFIAPAYNALLGERANVLKNTVFEAAVTQEEYVKKFNKPFTMSEAATIAVKAGEQTPAMGNAIVEIAEQLADPKLDKKGVLNLARFAFAPANMDFIQKHIPPKDQTKVFMRLTQDDIIKRIVATGDNETIENFKFWAKNEFKSLFAKHINDAQALEWDPQVKLDYNPQTNQFKLNVPDSLPRGAQWWLNTYQPLINELNNGISTLKNVLKLDQEDVPSYVTQLLAQSGYRQGAEAPPGFFKTMWDLLIPRVEEMAKGAVGERGGSGDASGQARGRGAF